MAFVLHNDPRGNSAFNADGSGIGFNGTERSLAVKLNSKTANHVELCHSGAGQNLADFPFSSTVAPVSFSDGLTHMCIVDYDGVTLSVYIDTFPVLQVRAWLPYGLFWLYSSQKHNLFEGQR